MPSPTCMMYVLYSFILHFYLIEPKKAQINELFFF